MNRLVIGCGYLGARVARHWRDQGDSVWATTRSERRAGEFRQRQWRPLVADITAPESLKTAFSGLPRIDTVLIAVGYDRNSHHDRRHVYVDGLAHVLDSLPTSAQHLVYISSTGVFGDANGDWVDETTPPNPEREGGKALWEAEGVLGNSPWKRRSTILRLAGLYGPGRIPNLDRVRQWLDGQDTSAVNRDGFLNLVHVSDVVRLVAMVAQREPAGELFLVSDGSPTLRREYYAYLESKLQDRRDGGRVRNQDPQRDAPAIRSGKRISNRKLLRTLDFRFEYPDFRLGVDQALSKGNCSE